MKEINLNAPRRIANPDGPGVIPDLNRPNIRDWPTGLDDSGWTMPLTAHSLAHKIEAAAIEGVSRVQSIMASKDLTSEAKTRRRAAVVEDVNGKFEVIKNEAALVHFKADETRGHLHVFVTAGDTSSPGRCVRDAELRAWYVSLTGSEQDEVLHNAYNENNKEVLHAISSAPAGMVKYPSEQMKALVHERVGALTQPELKGKSDAYDSASAHLTDAIEGSIHFFQTGTEESAGAAAV